MKIYAHRGIFGLYPENSKSAIREAFNKGFNVEIDIRFTKDKKIVVIHDRNLARLCGVNVNVENLCSTKIAKIPFLLKPDEFMQLFDELASYVLDNNIKEAGFAMLEMDTLLITSS